MIEAALLIGLGAALAKVGLVPLQRGLAARQDARDAARAAEIVEQIRRHSGTQ